MAVHGIPDLTHAEVLVLDYLMDLSLRLQIEKVKRENRCERSVEIEGEEIDNKKSENIDIQHKSDQKRERKKGKKERVLDTKILKMYKTIQNLSERTGYKVVGQGNRIREKVMRLFEMQFEEFEAGKMEEFEEEYTVEVGLEVAEEVRQMKMRNGEGGCTEEICEYILELQTQQVRKRVEREVKIKYKKRKGVTTKSAKERDKAVLIEEIGRMYNKYGKDSTYRGKRKMGIWSQGSVGELEKYDQEIQRRSKAIIEKVETSSDIEEVINWMGIEYPEERIIELVVNMGQVLLQGAEKPELREEERAVAKFIARVADDKGDMDSGNGGGVNETMGDKEFERIEEIVTEAQRLLGGDEEARSTDKMKTPVRQEAANVKKRAGKHEWSDGRKDNYGKTTFPTNLFSTDRRGRSATLTPPGQTGNHASEKVMTSAKYVRGPKEGDVEGGGRLHRHRSLNRSSSGSVNESPVNMARGSFARNNSENLVAAQFNIDNPGGETGNGEETRQRVVRRTSFELFGNAEVKRST
ncbi:hypothetical protein AX774_g4344 [Zancudomyces culisetae]|uniref:Uncharacterized protein n=1 Tax=Zancudomyces culisetae TaxID=1213189 RepID=A0A1R1PMJ4_ZANCU|nr:hypothetical protein AX774_g4344 [Zancudomyces culisetae]|eukprot:OMH82185.1 hypothetical protein AX774_g4344 [Zancudomyces culisetae]